IYSRETREALRKAFVESLTNIAVPKKEVQVDSNGLVLDLSFFQTASEALNAWAPWQPIEPDLVIAKQMMERHYMCFARAHAEFRKDFHHALAGKIPLYGYDGDEQPEALLRLNTTNSQELEKIKEAVDAAGPNLDGIAEQAGSASQDLSSGVKMALTV